MLRWMLAAGAAALAITSPALADRDQKGGGNKGHSGHAAKSDRGGGKAQRQKQQGVKFAQGDDRGKGQKAKGDDGSRGRGVKVDRDDQIKVNRGVKVDDDDVRVVRIDRKGDDVRFVPRWNERGLARGFVDGCPPGLAKKGNGCLPPGQAKKIVGTPLSNVFAASALSGPYRQWYPDDNRFYYRWDDDYIYRVRRDGGLIDALFPFANRDYYYYPVGMAYPADYNFYNVPYQYQAFYPNGDDYWYRYGDGAIYQINPTTGLIQGIAALLTGAPLAVGQPLPPAYGVYNVPFAYRSTYFDSPDAWYRYNDGYIYRVDPTTQLVTAVINALV